MVLGDDKLVMGILKTSGEERGLGSDRAEIWQAGPGTEKSWTDPPELGAGDQASRSGERFSGFGTFFE